MSNLTQTKKMSQFCQLSPIKTAWHGLLLFYNMVCCVILFLKLMTCCISFLWVPVFLYSAFFLLQGVLTLQLSILLKAVFCITTMNAVRLDCVEEVFTFLTDGTKSIFFYRLSVIFSSIFGQFLLGLVPYFLCVHSSS